MPVGGACLIDYLPFQLPWSEAARLIGEHAMKKLVFLGAMAGVFGPFASPADACSQRGQFCSYPAWAANAFEAPWNRVPGYSALPSEKSYAVPTPVKYYPVYKRTRAYSR